MRLLLLSILSLTAVTCMGQYPRLKDANNLSWFVYTGDHKLSSNWALHTEYQFRRVNGVKKPQQNLARLSVVRKLSDRLDVSTGYTHFQSFRYGQYPETPGRFEPEHRIYEDITLKDQVGKLGLEHRIRLEQRWLGSRDENGQGAVGSWEYQNRIRYQLAMEWALKGPSIDKGEFYLNAFDEVFIGFGRNVEDNVFNQNRLSAGLGYSISENGKVELNYLYQIRQHAQPDPDTGRSVVELNNGFRLNLIFGLDLTK